MRSTDDISKAATMEFRPLINEIGFRPPSPDDPRERKPKADDPDYSQKLEAHEAFNFERDVYQEVSHVRDDFSLLVKIVAESYGPDFFSYIQKNSQNEEIRRKYMVRTPEGYGLYDSTLRQPFNGAYILACADRVLKEKEEKDFKSRFARKAKSDLRAYLDLKAKREAELEELYTRPYEDIAVEEFLEKLPSPQVNDETTDKEGSPQEEESMPDISPHTEDEGELHDQGIWGKCKTVADPEAYKATKDAEAQNEDAFENLEKSNDKKGLVDTDEYKEFIRDGFRQNEDAFENLEKSNDKKGLVDTDEYKEFIRDGFRLERKSPLVMLKDQRNGYNYTGFFHTGIRDIEVDRHPKKFHVVYPTAHRRPPHAHQKFHLSETALFQQATFAAPSMTGSWPRHRVCKMLPIYARRPGRYDYVFRSGDVRSTLDDRLMAKASDVQEAALDVQENLLRKVRELHESGRPATREELLNAMLHLFLGVGVDEEEVGDLSLDKMSNPQLFRYGLGEEGPVPIYTSTTKYTALILNLGNFVRGRKKSAPSTFSDYIELDTGGQGNRGQYPDSCYTRTLERAGTDRVRVCAFHLNNVVASKKISIAHECLATMFADCLHYQVDLIGGDANMALYRAMGSKQESMDIRGGMYQSLLDYLLEGDRLGGRCYKDCQKPDWNTFPGLDPMTATVLEWGRSMTDDQWADFPANKNEFKIQVSEWLLNSTKESYLLGDQDLDSHTPLLMEVTVIYENDNFLWNGGDRDRGWDRDLEHLE
eukprot:s5925_g6.t1